jgi:hypothetical protein
MRKTLGVCLLVLLLIVPASAGIMPNLEPAPPPQPTSATQEPTGGEMPNGATDTMTQTVLDLLAVLPSLL